MRQLVLVDSAQHHAGAFAFEGTIPPLSFSGGVAAACRTFSGCNGVGNWDITEQGISSGNTDHVSTTPCPAVGTWTCVELDYTLDPPARARLYVGDALVIDTSVGDPAPLVQIVLAGVARADAAG